MHASICDKLQHKGFRLYFSPPDSTPYAQACDKVQINKRFQKTVIELYTTWVNESVPEQSLEDSDTVRLRNPSRRLLAAWVREAWQKIPDSDLLAAMRAAYFPAGMLFE
eukprot:EG_transcript_34373